VGSLVWHPRLAVRGRQFAQIMIRRHGTLLRLLLAVVDAVSALGLIALLSAVRFGSEWRSEWADIFAVPWAPAVLVIVGWVAVLWTQGLYRLRVRWSFRSQAVAMGQAMVVMALATLAALFLFKLPDVSRAFVLLLLPSLALISLLVRLVIHGFLTSLRRRGRNSRNLVIIGSGPAAIRFAHEIHGRPALGLRVIGYLNGLSNEPSMGLPFLGSYDDLAGLLHDQVVDEVAICLDLAEWEVIQSLVEVCRAEGKVVRIPLAGAFLGGSVTYVENLSGIPVLSLMEAPDRQIGLAIKRLVDISVAAVGLVVGLPLLVLISIAVLADSGWPVFFRQERVGLHGRRFRLVKFRTMVTDAEARRADLLHLNEVNGRAFKVTNDPRTTALGRILRRTSLDELPQLWNVLLGEMSMVGPRPPMPSEVDEYDPWHRRRLSMKPGITGLWQVAARREADFDRWVEMDLQYIDHWSLLLDTKIALRTLPAMLRAEGR
jgi:exopolysaccharide biosynthesis polyprenyl glycosylphosphotransferase